MALLPPIHNPEIPYVGPIDRGFTPGEMVRIQGKTLPTTKRFSINLTCGPNRNPRDDIALHVSVRVDDNYLVLNTLENGQWGKEQIPNIPLPIGPGQYFEMLLLTDDDDYKIAVNGQHFAEFKHRLPGSRVSHLNIDGDVEISLICYEGGTPTLPETSTEAGVSYSESAAKDSDISIDDFKPSGPPVNPGYRLPSNDDSFAPGYGPGPQGGYGPGPQGAYGPGPQGGYGPGPQRGYGPGPGYGGPGGYGPPGGPGPNQGPGGYGPPPQQDSKPGGGLFENLLGQASSAIAGAMASGALNSILHQPAQHGPIGGGYPGYQGPGGGPLSSLLSSLTQGQGQNQNQQGGAGGPGILGGLLSSALSQPSHGGQQGGQQQNQGGGSGGGLGGFLSDAFSQLASGGGGHHQNRQY